jgi:hypothetical protein
MEHMGWTRPAIDAYWDDADNKLTWARGKTWATLQQNGGPTTSFPVSTAPTPYTDLFLATRAIKAKFWVPSLPRPLMDFLNNYLPNGRSEDVSRRNVQDAYAALSATSIVIKDDRTEFLWQYQPLVLPDMTYGGKPFAFWPPDAKDKTIAANVARGLLSMFAASSNGPPLPRKHDKVDAWHPQKKAWEDAYVRDMPASRHDRTVTVRFEKDNKSFSLLRSMVWPRGSRRNLTDTLDSGDIANFAIAPERVGDPPGFGTAFVVVRIGQRALVTEYFPPTAANLNTGLVQFVEVDDLDKSKYKSPGHVVVDKSKLATRWQQTRRGVQLIATLSPYGIWNENHTEWVPTPSEINVYIEFPLNWPNSPPIRVGGDGTRTIILIPSLDQAEGYLLAVGRDV